VEEYDSADEVRQLIYSMEGQSRRSRRMLYSRGGIASDEKDATAGDEDQSF